MIAYRINFVAEWNWCSFALNVIAYCIRFIAMNKTWDYISENIVYFIYFVFHHLVLFLFYSITKTWKLPWNLHANLIVYLLVYKEKKRCITRIWISEIEHNHLFIRMLICNLWIQQKNAIHTWISKIQEISHFLFLFFLRMLFLLVSINRATYVMHDICKVLLEKILKNYLNVHLKNGTIWFES